MKVTSIKTQINHSGRYSVFIEGQYAFSLSSSALLDSKLVSGQELGKAQLEAFKQRSAEDLLYEQALKYASQRLHTAWEVQIYLTRKNASPALSKSILNKLSDVSIVNDESYAKAYINDRQLFRPTSRRKIILELRKKHITDEVIQSVLADTTEPDTEHTALQTVIKRMRKQSRYQNDLKLMQYLSRQGFSYGDIKDALKSENQEL